MNYKTSLELLWSKHLEPKQPNAPTVISLFAGGGGSSLGYSMSGFKELCAVEFWKPAYTCLNDNFEFPVITKDIRTVTGEEIRALTNLQIGQLDVLDMSPVCCGFSPAGKQNPDDERNFLFKAAVSILKDLQPKAFIMENVPQMACKRFAHIFEQIEASLMDAGYNIIYKVLSAKDFGIPTVRKRIFIVGIRKDFNKTFDFPSSCSEEVPVKEVLELLGEGNYKPLTELYQEYWKHADFGKPVGKQKSCKKLNPEKPSCVIVCGGENFHPFEPRLLSLNELMYIQGFPQGFKFRSRGQGRKIIGNSVCPPLMHILSSELRKQVLD